MRRVDPNALTTESCGVRATRIGVNLGAEIDGVDLRLPLEDGPLAAVTAALVEHEVVVFRGQPLSSAELLAFGRRFGELSVHPFSPRDGSTPELIKFRNDETTPPFGTDVWHSDETFRAQPPLATVLCAKEVPAVGGDTLFASMTAAYEGLSDRLRRFIDGLEAVHDFRVFKALFGTGESDRRRLHEFELKFPPQVHPVVRIHPVSGRKALFVNPNFTVAIKDMDERESRSLLDTLFHQALIPEYQMRLRWAADTVTMWDNRSVQHYAVHDYYPQRRYMERVTIRGGPVVGPPSATAGEVRKRKLDVPPGVDPYGGHKPH